MTLTELNTLEAEIRSKMDSTMRTIHPILRYNPKETMMICNEIFQTSLRLISQERRKLSE